MRKILFAANENPNASAERIVLEVSGLAAALKRRDQNLDVRVILPLDAGMERLGERLAFAAQFSMENENIAVYSCEYNGAACYFADCRSFPHASFFCKAVPEAMPALNFFPDVLHALDLPAAASVIYIKEKAGRDGRYAGIRRVFTLSRLSEAGEPSGNINRLKSAVESADAVAVGPALTMLDFSKELRAFLEQYRYKLFEIGEFDREFENSGLFMKIAAEKERYKSELQKRTGLPEKPDVPLIAVMTRFSDRKKLDTLALGAEEILKEDVQLVVLGKGDAYFEKFFQNLAARHPRKAKAIISFDRTLARFVSAGADMTLLPDDGGIFGAVSFPAAEYGAVPLYGSEGDGHGFSFSPYSVWNLLGAIRQASARYQNKEAWNSLVKKIVRQDFIRKRTAEEYLKVYNSLIKQ